MTSTADEDETSPAPEPCATGRAGPAVVALGGGHGLAASLQAARTYAGDLTGVVSVGDDGGSSGRLRAELGVAAPGDIRRCISALAGDNLLARSLEYRFGGDGSLTGHPIGNLLLTGLSMASGDFEAAIAELCRLTEVRGCLHPATSGPVRLLADSNDGPVTGQVTIEQVGSISNLRVEPADPDVPDGALDALARADQVIIGPGSLYTSVLAATVVPRIRSALHRTGGQRVFVANVANDRAEARGFGLAEHVGALAAHGVPVDTVIAHRRAGDGVDDGRAPDRIGDLPVLWSDVAADDGWGHAPDRLGAALARALSGHAAAPHLGR